jgi:transcriptional regulator with XRE-family HTH domain
MKNPITSDLVRERVLQILYKKHITKKQLAESINMDESQLRRLLNEHKTIPVDVLVPWAECLGVDLNEITQHRQCIQKQITRPTATIVMTIEVEQEYLETLLNQLSRL